MLKQEQNRQGDTALRQSEDAPKPNGEMEVEVEYVVQVAKASAITEETIGSSKGMVPVGIDGGTKGKSNKKGNSEGMTANSAKGDAVQTTHTLASSSKGKSSKNGSSSKGESQDTTQTTLSDSTDTFLSIPSNSQGTLPSSSKGESEISHDTTPTVASTGTSSKGMSSKKTGSSSKGMATTKSSSSKGKSSKKTGSSSKGKSSKKTGSSSKDKSSKKTGSSSKGKSSKKTGSSSKGSNGNIGVTVPSLTTIPSLDSEDETSIDDDNPNVIPNPDRTSLDNCLLNMIKVDGQAKEVLECTSSQDYNFAQEWVTLDSTLTCPVDDVRQVGLVMASRDTNVGCECETELTTWVFWVLGIEDEITSIACNCYACPSDTEVGRRGGFAYQCDSAITGQCLNFDCEARCNGMDPAILPPIQGFLPTNSPTPGFSSPITTTPQPTPPPTEATRNATSDIASTYSLTWVAFAFLLLKSIMR